MKDLAAFVSVSSSVSFVVSSSVSARVIAVVSLASAEGTASSAELAAEGTASTAELAVEDAAVGAIKTIGISCGGSTGGTESHSTEGTLALVGIGVAKLSVRPDQLVESQDDALDGNEDGGQNESSAHEGDPTPDGWDDGKSGQVGNGERDNGADDSGNAPDDVQAEVGQGSLARLPRAPHDGKLGHEQFSEESPEGADGLSGGNDVADGNLKSIVRNKLVSFLGPGDGFDGAVVSLGAHGLGGGGLSGLQVGVGLLLVVLVELHVGSNHLELVDHVGVLGALLSLGSGAQFANAASSGVLGVVASVEGSLIGGGQFEVSADGGPVSRVVLLGSNGGDDKAGDQHGHESVLSVNHFA